MAAAEGPSGETAAPVAAAEDVQHQKGDCTNEREPMGGTSDATGHTTGAIECEDASAAASVTPPAPTSSNLRGPDAFSARAATAASTDQAVVQSEQRGFGSEEALTFRQLGGSSHQTAASPQEGSRSTKGSEEAAASGQPLGGTRSGGGTFLTQDAAASRDGNQRHYWGQALQHLEHTCGVEGGSRVTLLAKRDGPTIRFCLRVRINHRRFNHSACLAS